MIMIHEALNETSQPILINFSFMTLEYEAKKEFAYTESE